MQYGIKLACAEHVHLGVGQSKCVHSTSAGLCITWVMQQLVCQQKLCCMTCYPHVCQMLPVQKHVTTYRDPRTGATIPGLGRRIALDVARGLHFLHARSVVHFDLKSANILLARDFTAKIADVGLAKIMQQQFLSTLYCVGTFAWAAPEVGTPTQSSSLSTCKFWCMFAAYASSALHWLW